MKLPVPTLDPVVLPSAAKPALARACEQLREALIHVAGPSRWNPAVPMPDGLERLVATESLELPRLSACRLDALCDADGTNLRFLEVQAGDPSGTGWTDCIAEGLAGYAPLTVQRRAQLPPGRVAVVNEDGSFVETDTALMAQLVGGQRIDPSRFAWDGARLTCGGVAFDAVMRDSHEELTLQPAKTAALRAALEAGLPRLNPFRDVWFDDKACFAMLWAQRASWPAVAAHVPETFVVTPPDAARLRAERAAWVLKPAVGYGGFGVVVGDASDAATWDAAVAEALTRRTVAQRFVPGGKRPDGRYVTFSFWVIGGAFAGAFARAGTRPVVNVHQGGGIGPVVFRP